MQSMLDQIKEVEAQAAAIRQDAALRGREMMAAVQQEVKDQKEAAVSTQRTALREATIKAEQGSEESARELIAKRDEETTEACANSEQKIDKAVAYLIGRVVNDA